ncbi:MAG: sialidase family protein [Caldilineaceae bacterium]
MSNAIQEVMHTMQRFPNQWSCLIGFLCVFWLLSPTAVTVAQEEEQTAQPAAAYPYQLYLPTVHSDMNVEETALALKESIEDEADLALADLEMVSSAALQAVVDTTEDYKALGYPDSRKIVRDDTGNLYIAYRKKLNGQYRIFLAKSTDQGSSWQVLNHNQPIETVGDYTQRVPSLAVGRNADNTANYLHVAWYGNDSTHTGNNRQIKYTRLTTEGIAAADGCCTAAFIIDGYNGEALWQEHPTLYVNGSNVYLVWEGRDATAANSKIKFVRSTNYGQQWTQPLNIAPATPGNFSRPALVVTYVGTQRQLYVVAYANNNGLSQIYWSRSLDNGNSWTAWQPVAATNADQRHVSIARDKAGNLHLVWRQLTSDKSRSILRYRVYDPARKQGAGAWVGSAQTIASRSRQCLFFPSIALGSNDRVWVIWTQSKSCATLPNDNPTEGQIVYRSKAAGGKWGNPVTLTGSGAHTYASFRSAPTPNSEVMDVTWLDISQCVTEQPTPDVARATEEADVTAATGCLIRYTTIQ